MINSRKMNVEKRIAFAASENNRKSLIEWSYYNQEILKGHELIATGAMADILEGTIGVPVTRLHDGAAAANQQLASLITSQKIDILLFFWDPSEPLPFENGVRALHDLAINSNIIVACNLATADFVLSSSLMTKAHSVPVQPKPSYSQNHASYFNTGESKRVVLKVNTIN